MRRIHKIPLIIFSSLLWICALALGGEVLVFLSYASLLFWAVPVLHSLAGLLFLRVTISMPARTLICGETLVISYQMQNLSILSFPSIILESLINRKLSTVDQKALAFSLGGKEVVKWDASIECKRRGVYKTGDVRMTVKNIYGIGEFGKIFSGSLDLIVYPKVLKLRSLSIGATRQSGELIVTDPLCTNPNELCGLGFWKLGTSMKHIHWKASARNGEWLVKNYEMRGDSEVTLLVDCCSLDYPSDDEQVIEDAVVTIIASISGYLLSRSVDVTLMLLGPAYIKKIRGAANADLPAFLLLLAGFSPVSGTPVTGSPGFASLMESSSYTINGGSSTFIIGPSLDKSIALQGLRLQSGNRKPKFIVVGIDGAKNPRHEIISANARILNSEGISVHYVDCKGDLREQFG